MLPHCPECLKKGNSRTNSSVEMLQEGYTWVLSSLRFADFSWFLISMSKLREAQLENSKDTDSVPRSQEFVFLRPG